MDIVQYTSLVALVYLMLMLMVVDFSRGDKELRRGCIVVSVLFVVVVGFTHYYMVHWM